MSLTNFLSSIGLTGNEPSHPWDTHPDTLASINNLGWLLKAQGKLGETELLYREAVRGAKKTLGDAHPTTVIFVRNLDFLLREMGKA